MYNKKAKHIFYNVLNFLVRGAYPSVIILFIKVPDIPAFLPTIPKA